MKPLTAVAMTAPSKASAVFLAKWDPKAVAASLEIVSSVVEHVQLLQWHQWVAASLEMACMVSADVDHLAVASVDVHVVDAFQSCVVRAEEFLTLFKAPVPEQVWLHRTLTRTTPPVVLAIS